MSNNPEKQDDSPLPLSVKIDLVKGDLQLAVNTLGDVMDAIVQKNSTGAYKLASLAESNLHSVIALVEQMRHDLDLPADQTPPAEGQTPSA